MTIDPLGTCKSIASEADMSEKSNLIGLGLFYEQKSLAK